MFVPSRHVVKYIQMYLNTNILEGLKYNYKYFVNINVFKYEYIEKYFKYFSFIFQILFILYYYVGKKKSNTYIDTSSL